ncbi:MAG: hypothetical protein DRR11_04110 [Gammaproteobacteria bacterium]|nr:MAG: hypothetical protein DRR11_04110 [Gammaproteobacteria bacterium]RLA37159.1 MAG: hypothetical protein DRR15_02830 [Gammaproteobacteria bacterium]
MKNRNICLVPMFILVGACAPQGSGFGLAHGELTAKRTCEPPGVILDCQDSDYAVRSSLKIIVNPAQVVVQPNNVCVISPGEITVTVQFAGKPKKNSVRTVPENLADIWIFGDNRDDAEEFTITVDDAVEAGQYKYGVATIDAGCIDPRMSVKKT